jgi:hypothetical protein
MRNNTPALQRGRYLPVSISSAQCLSYARSYGEQVIVLIHNLGLTEANPTLSLSESSLPAGNYYVNDLYSQSNVGEITINSEGGFEDWQPSVPIAESKSWILSFDETPLQTSNIETVNLETPYLYPNPTEGILRFSGINNSNNPIQAEVIDATGRQLLLTTLSLEKSLDVSFLSPGLYWIRLLTMEQNAVIPFVKVTE